MQRSQQTIIEHCQQKNKRKPVDNGGSSSSSRSNSNSNSNSSSSSSSGKELSKETRRRKEIDSGHIKARHVIYLPVLATFFLTSFAFFWWPSSVSANAFGKRSLMEEAMTSVRGTCDGDGVKKCRPSRRLLKIAENQLTRGSVSSGRLTNDNGGHHAQEHSKLAAPKGKMCEGNSLPGILGLHGASDVFCRPTSFSKLFPTGNLPKSINALSKAVLASTEEKRKDGARRDEKRRREEALSTREALPKDRRKSGGGESWRPHLPATVPFRNSSSSSSSRSYSDTVSRGFSGNSSSGIASDTPSLVSKNVYSSHDVTSYPLESSSAHRIAISKSADSMCGATSQKPRTSMCKVNTPVEEPYTCLKETVEVVCRRPLGCPNGAPKCPTYASTQRRSSHRVAKRSSGQNGASSRDKVAGSEWKVKGTDYRHPTAAPTPAVVSQDTKDFLYLSSVDLPSSSVHTPRSSPATLHRSPSTRSFGSDPAEISTTLFRLHPSPRTEPGLQESQGPEPSSSPPAAAASSMPTPASCECICAEEHITRVMNCYRKTTATVYFPCKTRTAHSQC